MSNEDGDACRDRCAGSATDLLMIIWFWFVSELGTLSTAAKSANSHVLGSRSLRRQNRYKECQMRHDLRSRER